MSDKEYMVLYIYTTQWSIYIEILLSQKDNKTMSFAAIWMDLESITLGEVTQTKKDKNCMLPLMDGI